MVMWRVTQTFTKVTTAIQEAVIRLTPYLTRVVFPLIYRQSSLRKTINTKRNNSAWFIRSSRIKA